VDGQFPQAGLLLVGSSLYGTTLAGGARGYGTVFSLSTSNPPQSVPQLGAEKVLYSFGSVAGDGLSPQASLIAVGSTLYGTTAFGGKYRKGTVFSVTAGGTEKVVYSFGNGKDGATPVAGLLAVGNQLYGTTGGGGTSGLGTIFSLTTAGQETVLHSFGGKIGTTPDGRTPQAALTNLNAAGTALYGTTFAGGKYGGGSVFTIATSGKTYAIVYSFGKPGDGAGPRAPLVNLAPKATTLYGTTTTGGKYGQGIAFSLTTAGTETILHSFGAVTGGSYDGSSPAAPLTYVGGTLYGTTQCHGNYYCTSIGPAGTVFSLSPKAPYTEKVLTTFGNGSGGAFGGLFPRAGLVNAGGYLYGTTVYGGAPFPSGVSPLNSGVVFAISP
jgi:uncharacterized repeat protein (TIGR03803 family)